MGSGGLVLEEGKKAKSAGRRNAGARVEAQSVEQDNEASMDAK